MNDINFFYFKNKIILSFNYKFLIMLLDIFVDEFSTLSNIYRSRKNYSLYLSKKLFSLLKQKYKSNYELNKPSSIKKKREFLIKRIIELRNFYLIKIQSKIR